MREETGRYVLEKEKIENYLKNAVASVVDYSSLGCLRKPVSQQLENCRLV